MLFFSIPSTLCTDPSHPILQAWNLLAKTTSQHPGALSGLCNSGEVELLLAAKQLHKPPRHLTAHPASPDTSWTPGLSWLLAHRQHFFLLPPGSAFRASIRMGRALQGNGRFEYMREGTAKARGYCFGVWESPARKGLCSLGKRLPKRQMQRPWRK